MRRLRAPGLAAAALAAAGCGADPGMFPEYPFQPARHFRPADRTAAEIDTIVFHTTEGGFDPGRTFRENQRRAYLGTVRYFQSPDREVSAHFVVGPAGEVTQMVRTSSIAYHATYYNARSIGIECAGWADRAETWTPELLEALVELSAKLCRRYGIVAVRPEGDALSSGGRFAGSGLVEHRQIQTPGSAVVVQEGKAPKTDPGPHFPWQSFLARVQERLHR
jgi:N-acetyl-anhydromuramyl-L-alanine amidase AmpD